MSAARRSGRAAGNDTQRFGNTAVLAVCGLDAPQVVTSAEFDERLAQTYARLRMRAGMLERIAGVRERRWWPTDVGFTDAAALAGAKALPEAGVDPDSVGLLIDTSVSRAHLEPSSAVAVHHALGCRGRGVRLVGHGLLHLPPGLHGSHPSHVRRGGDRLPARPVDLPDPREQGPATGLQPPSPSPRRARGSAAATASC